MIDNIAELTAVSLLLVLVFSAAIWFIVRSIRRRRPRSAEADPSAHQEVLRILKNIDKNLSKIALCVQSDHHSHGDKHSLSIKHWND